MDKTYRINGGADPAPNFVPLPSAATIDPIARYVISELPVKYRQSRRAWRMFVGLRSGCFAFFCSLYKGQEYGKSGRHWRFVCVPIDAAFLSLPDYRFGPSGHHYGQLRWYDGEGQEIEPSNSSWEEFRRLMGQMLSLGTHTEIALEEGEEPVEMPVAANTGDDELFSSRDHLPWSKATEFVAKPNSKRIVPL